MSFSTHFPADDRNCKLLVNRMGQATSTLQQLSVFYKERIALEEEYSRRLQAISKKALGSYELNNLKNACTTLKDGTELISKSHYNLSKKSNELNNLLQLFTSDFIAKRKTVETTIENLMKSKRQLVNEVKQAENRFTIENSKLNSFIAQQNLLLGREAERNRDKIYDQQKLVARLKNDVDLNTKKLNELHEFYKAEWLNTTDKLEQLEKERIDFIIKNLWEFSNQVSNSCLADDVTCTNLRDCLYNCDPNDEVRYFCDKFGACASAPVAPVAPVAATDTTSVYSTAAPAQPKLARKHPLHPAQSSHTHQTHHDDNQTQVSNNSSSSSQGSNHSIQLSRNESSSSNPTSISSFADSIDNNERISKNWNSPLRRKSRTSFGSEIELNKRSNSSHSRKSFILNLNQPLVSDEGASSTTTSTDPLRRSLDNLKRSKDFDLTNEIIDLTITESNPNSSPVKFTTSRKSSKTLRPKSMIETVNSNPSPIKPTKSINSSKSNGSIKSTNIFSKSLRKSSKSFTNLSSRLSSNSSEIQQQPQQPELPAVEIPKQLPTITSNGHPVVKYAKAIYDFIPNLESELEFKENDILLVINMQDDGWWNCENFNSGKIGLAPYNYLDKL